MINAAPTTPAWCGRSLPISTPRWLTVFKAIAIALGLVFVVLHLTGNGLGGHKP